MNLQTCFALTALVLPACATHSSNDSAAELRPDPGAELDGPGIRLRPAGTSSNCTFVSTRPTSLPATAPLEGLTLQLNGSSTRTALKAGTTLRVAAGTYNVTSSSFGVATVNCTAGSTQNVTPVYAGSALPLPFSYVSVPRAGSAGAAALVPSTTGAWWSAVPVTGTTAVTTSGSWTINSDVLVDITSRRTADGVLDLAAVLATVVVELDDVDPGYPTNVPISLRNRDSRYVFGGNPLRDLPARFLVGPTSWVELAQGEWKSAVLTAGSRTTLTFRRLEVDHLIPDGAAAIPGTFKVSNAAGATVLSYDRVPTHTGVDLLPGTYTVTITATDARGVPYTDVQSVTL